MLFPDGFRSSARVAKVDPDWDLAALIVWKPNAQPVPLADGAPRIGEPLMIAGYGSGDFLAQSGRCTQYVAPAVNLLGLPDDAAAMFLFGFFRRDYGAAGLFDMSRDGLLNIRQLTVAAVTLTLFVPCVAQFLMMIRERGAKFAFASVIVCRS